MDGIPALDLWNLVIEVFHYYPNQSNKTKDSLAQGDLLHRTTSSKRTKNQTKAPTTHDSSDLFHVPSNAKFSQSNEAVIKMIIKGRSPTMRHVSRTHRVALDWLFDKINLDPKIQVRYIDTKHQLLDILTKDNFTRDENSSLISCTGARTDRRKQDCGEIQADGDDPGQFCSYRFFICEQSGCVEKHGDTQSFMSTGWIIRETWCKHNAASSYQGWQN